MEAKHFETEQALETCSRSEEDLLLERFKQEQEQLELARKHFDDMEFQQLEVILLYHIIMSAVSFHAELAGLCLRSIMMLSSARLGG